MKNVTINIMLTIVAVISMLLSDCGGYSQVPMNMIKKQNKMRSTERFIHEMIVPHQSRGSQLKGNERIFNSSTQTGFNSQAVSIMANQIATPDLCDPRLMSVAIPPDSDPLVMYWPTCTKLEQCGGCGCGHDLLECVATSSETVIVQVMKQKVSEEDPNRYDYLGNVDIPLQRHTSCDCRCKIKAEHCNPITQEYDSDSCLCRCKNAADATSCQLPKRWDSSSCRCACPTLKACLDNESFDFNTCSCVPTASVAQGLRAADVCAGMSCRSGMTPRKESDGVCRCKRARRSTSN